MNNDLDYSLCILAEIKYKKKHPDKTDVELFPIGWFSNTNYKLKCEIIVEAIKSEKTIWEIPSYQEMIEGVKEK